MNRQNYLPYEITSDFCEAEEKIADILMTYTMNRKQEPHPLYYKAVAGAAKQIFIKFEESLTCESFGDFDDEGEIDEFSLDVHDLKQYGIASYIEAQMLAPLLGDYFSSINAYGEKIAIKYGFFETEPDEFHAVAALLEKAADEPHRDPEPTHIRQFARFFIEVLDKKMAETMSWTPETAEEFFEELIQLQPAWIWRQSWRIAALDLYEWFCLKNNLTFYQFPALYTAHENTDYRLGAHALRYPSEDNKFTQILPCLQKFSREHHSRPSLRYLETEDDAFIQPDVFKPVERLAAIDIAYRGREHDREYHQELLDHLAGLVSLSFRRNPFGSVPDEEELDCLYHDICTCLGIERVITDEEFSEYCLHAIVDDDDENHDEYFDSYLQKWVRNQDEDKTAWIVKTTLDSYADCLESGQTVDKICERIPLDADVTNDAQRAELFSRLQKELKDAYEPKLANHIAYAVFVRLVAEAYHETPAEQFNLKLAVARHSFTDSEYRTRQTEVPEHLQALAAYTRTIFPDDPLIANQLASKIYTVATGISEYEDLTPISHHYYLAGEIRELIEYARSACDTSGPIQRIARLHGYRGDQIYSTDLVHIDTLYRTVCRAYMKQPCVDISRVM